MAKVCLDAGHYGSAYNKGAVDGYYESLQMWKLTQYQKEALNSLGVEVVLVRNNIQDNPELISRGKTARGCDLFISNHSNATSSTTTDYPCAIVFSGSAELDKKSNSIGLELAQVIADELKTKQQGKVITRLSEIDRDKNGKLDDEYFGVLYGAKSVGVPGIILEHSFHTNPTIAKMLMSDARLQILANRQAVIIAKFLEVKIGYSGYYIKIKQDKLNIRKEPDTYSEIVAQVYKDEVYKVYVSSGKWLRLASWGGWVYNEYVEKI